MSYVELIEKLKALPNEKQAEVFDFVEYLAARFARPTTTEVDAWNDKDFTDMSMQQALRGMEDDPVTYTDADLREHWQ
jgi:hypothetical protein